MSYVRNGIYAFSLHKIISDKGWRIAHRASPNLPPWNPARSRGDIVLWQAVKEHRPERAPGHPGSHQRPACGTGAEQVLTHTTGPSLITERERSERDFSAHRLLPRILPDGVIQGIWRRSSDRRTDAEVKRVRDAATPQRRERVQPERLGAGSAAGAKSPQ